MRSVTETISKLIHRSRLDQSHEGTVALEKARSMAKAHGINLGLLMNPGSTTTAHSGYMPKKAQTACDDVAYDWFSETWYDCKTMKPVLDPYGRKR